MGLQDRDWYQEEIERKTGHASGRPAPKSEFARLLGDKDRGKTGRPWWLSEWLRLTVFFGILAVLYSGWQHFQG